MHIDISEFVKYWKNTRSRTTRVLAQLPETDLEWSCAADKFTFGDIYRHLSGMERYMFAENAKQRSSCYPGHSVDLARGVDEVRSYNNKCHAEALEIFSSLTLEELNSKCQTPAGNPITVWKWLRSMVEHEAHHQGQLYLMASVRGISIEPLFGLTEEEVLARS